MKKIALLPVAALLMLGACSKDDPVVRPVPNDPVATVPSQADQVTLNAPAQSEVKPEGSYYRVSYANGQEIVYAFASTGSRYIATIKKIEGTSADVVVPSTVNYNDLTLTVYSIDLYVNGISDNVTSLTLPKTAVAMYTSTGYEAITPDYITAQMERGNNLRKVELEDGFTGYCSINGAIYTADYKTLVSVPRAYPGTFTVAEATEVINARALYYCSQIEVLTIPAGVTEIGDEAVVFNDNLLLINCQPTEAPQATRNAFGTFAHNGVLRVPLGSEDSYKIVKPELVIPQEPVEPAADATDEEWDAYDEAYEQYQVDMAEYLSANRFFTQHEGWSLFNNIEGVTF
ncbi:MAG: hypothetical protein K2F87_02395 [Muribaculaceae bacterium]|nr:hypothetical protein [Muribaculaceae bacterium]